MTIGFEFLTDYFRIIDMIRESETKIELHNAKVKANILRRRAKHYSGVDLDLFINYMNQIDFEIDFLNILVSQGVRLRKETENIKYITKL